MTECPDCGKQRAERWFVGGICGTCAAEYERDRRATEASVGRGDAVDYERRPWSLADVYRMQASADD
jgi:hypothetical protein